MAPARHSYRLFSWIVFHVAILLLVQVGAQTVSMVPHVSIPTTTEFLVYVYLDSDDQDVQGVEIKLTFDKTIVRLDEITAGDWFTTSGLDYFFWDYTTPGADTIHFTGALLHEGQVTSGVIGICHFAALGPGICPVDFVDVDVRNSINQDLGAGHSVGDQIIIDNAIRNERLGFGEIKMLYR